MKQIIQLFLVLSILGAENVSADTFTCRGGAYGAPYSHQDLVLTIEPGAHFIPVRFEGGRQSYFEIFPVEGNSSQVRLGWYSNDLSRAGMGGPYSREIILMDYKLLTMTQNTYIAGTQRGRLQISFVGDHNTAHYVCERD